MKEKRLQRGRIAYVRDICCKAIDLDGNKAEGAPGQAGLTDRQWLAWSVLNILDGKIDSQIKREMRR